MVTDLDDVLFKYVSQSNPKSNDDLKRYLRLYPVYRQEIIEFTATWRALSILERVQPPLDTVDERQLMQHAKVHLRTMQRNRASARREDAKGESRIRKRRHAA